MSDPFLGQITMFGGNFAPRGWAFCNGQLLSIAQNTALFSILGTTYGGDGRTTFGLPDLRGRAAIHPGQGPGLSTYKLGEKGGVEKTTLSVANLASHSHPVEAGGLECHNANGNTTGAQNGFPATSSEGDNVYSNQGGANMAASLDVTVGNTGGSQPFSNVQPYQSVNFIIALQGIFPSRN